MVTPLISSTRTGLSDWVIQRLSSLVLLSYFAVIGYQLLVGVDYSSWSELHDEMWMKVLTFSAALGLVAHSWIGLCSVFDDYITERMMGPKGKGIRYFCQFCSGLLLAGYLGWVLIIVGG